MEIIEDKNKDQWINLWSRMGTIFAILGVGRNFNDHLEERPGFLTVKAEENNFSWIVNYQI